MGKPYINAIKTRGADGKEQDSLIVEGKYAPNFEAADDKKDAFCKTIRPAYDAARLLKGVEKSYITASLNMGDEGYKSYFVNVGIKQDGKQILTLKEQGKEDAETIFINVNESKKIKGDKIFQEVMLNLDKGNAEKLGLDKIEVNTFKNKEGVEQQAFKVTTFLNVPEAVKAGLVQELKDGGEGSRLELKEKGNFVPTNLDEMWAKKATPSKEQEAPKVDKKDKEQAIDM